MCDSTFQDCIMAAFQVPFLDIVKSQTVQQNNFLNDSSMQKIIILSEGAGLWILFLCFLKLNKGFCWFRH